MLQIHDEKKKAESSVHIALLFAVLFCILHRLLQCLFSVLKYECSLFVYKQALFTKISTIKILTVLQF